MKTDKQRCHDYLVRIRRSVMKVGNPRSIKDKDLDSDVTKFNMELVNLIMKYENHFR